MTCRDVIEFLDAYLSGELPAAERSRFDEHIAGCAACLAYIASYERTLELTRSAVEDADEESIPEELVAAILAARKRKS